MRKHKLDTEDTLIKVSLAPTKEVDNPLTLLLKVGGNTDNIAKLIVNPAAAGPLRVMLNQLLLFGGAFAGVKVVVTCSQVVCVPFIGIDAEPKDKPEAVWKPTAAFPVKLDVCGNL